MRQKNTFDETYRKQEHLFREEIARLKSDWTRTAVQTQEKACRESERQAKQEYEFNMLQFKAESERKMKAAVTLATAKEREKFNTQQANDEKKHHLTLIALRAQLQERFDAEQVTQMELHRAEMERMRATLDRMAKQRWQKRS